MLKKLLIESKLKNVYLVFVSCSSSTESLFVLISPNAVVPNNLIWLKLILVESRGLYSLIRTAVATSGCDKVRRMNVKPAVGIGGQTGIKGLLLSLEISSATADGHAI